MDDKKRIKILRNALRTIAIETKEPFCKVYAQSALQETVDEVPVPDTNNHCQKHDWFGAVEEKCPLCNS